ncbi:MAG: CRISPR-associated helicase Cas3' [Phycisphaerae bacterium]
MTEFLAHLINSRPEPLEDHLQLASKLAADFALSFGAEEWGKLAGLWHDLGKYSEEFQTYLRVAASGATNSCDTNSPRPKGPDHATAGAQHANERLKGVAGRILAYCIVGHHGGLRDAVDEGGGRSGLNERLVKVVPDCRDNAPRELLEAPSLRIPAMNWREGAAKSFQVSVFCRMLFSCLVDADFLATEQFMNPKRASHRPGELPPLEMLLDRLDVHLAKLEAKSKATGVNARRREVLAACREKAAMSPGLFSLTVPAGGGKTLSSLAFALTHAVQHDLRRIIYAIPFTSIIEQNAQVYRNALGASGNDVVLEHHSNFEHTKAEPGRADLEEKDPEEVLHNRMAAENWDAQIVVTTNVQLFESLFASRGARCRKLHRIVNSVIVLDEVQTLPVELLRPTLAMLDELCRNYGCTVVLRSATQPAIEHRDGFSIGLQDVREIIADPPALFTALQRVDVERIGRVEDPDLIARLGEHNQVLCVVNKRQHAADVFRLLESQVGSGVFHLSASMCAHHRRETLNLIRCKLEQGAECRVVSTQLIEAGVDIDFPVVYRAMTGIDSIAQAAGRCNREGRRDRGRAYVFDTEVDPRDGLRRRRQTGEEVAGEHDDILSLEAVEHYFSLLYWTQKDAWDTHDIMKCFSYSKRGLHAQFRKAASGYRLIRDEQHPIIVPYGKEGERLIEELKSMPKAPDRRFSRRAQRFAVGVYGWHLEKLRDATLITPHHDRFWVLDEPNAYDDQLGLLRDPPERNPENLIV